jgi:uncharacterized membrane protein
MQDTKKIDDHPTGSLGLPKNTASALCYAMGFFPYVGWLTGLLFLFFEKDKDIRFHALQSLAFFGGLAVLQIVFKDTVLFGKLWSLIWVTQFIVWLMLMYRTYNGEKWVLPVVGKFAQDQVNKMK